uniref:CCHC-type domain-containing protein n=1 Tax=Tanacetum cinerariifolium TaxID=118510 RepID=A0A6L2NW56_TANCI|nr:hypothetical protein [Tanacetum cinerariifolium]
MLQVLPTASYEDPTAKYFATVSAKEFPLLLHFLTTREEVFPLLSWNNKWHQSLVRSFDQEKNNIQVEARLVEFKNQEIKFCKKIRDLEFKVESQTDRIKSITKELEELKKEKEGLDTKLTGFQSASKDLDNLLESQRSEKNKEGLGYNAVPPPPAQVYSPPKKDMSWTGLPEFSDDTITDYSRPSSTIQSNSDDLQNRNSFDTKTGESSSTISSKPVIKFVKAADRPTEIKTNKVETVKNLLQKLFDKNKACFNCGEFDHLSYDCGKWVDQRKSWPKNNYTDKSMSSKDVFHKTGTSPTRINRSNVNSARPKTTQDLMIILIQRVKRLERELKVRTPPIKIHKVDRGKSKSVMAWVPKMVLFFYVKGNSGTKLEDSVRLNNKVVDYILQVKIKLLIKKLEDSEAEHQV